MSSVAQACSLCSSSICGKHRVLCGNVTYTDGKALGGINCQCNDADMCYENQVRVRLLLGVPAVERQTVSEPMCKRGKRQGKFQGRGTGKGKAEKGQSQWQGTKKW